MTSQQVTTHRGTGVTLPAGPGDQARRFTPFHLRGEIRAAPPPARVVTADEIQAAMTVGEWAALRTIHEQVQAKVGRTMSSETVRQALRQMLRAGRVEHKIQSTGRDLPHLWRIV